MSTPAPAREAPWHAGLRSARANLLPGLVLQVVALALVLGYYRSATAREALGRLAGWRAEWGVGFAMLSTGLCGGLLPFIYLRASAATRARYTIAQGLAVTAFWTYKGFEVDLWYRVLAHVVGSGHEARTVVIKSLLDQFVYCPILAVPVTVLVYFWVEQRFDHRAVVADLRAPGWYARSVVPLLISNLGVWLPAVCIIYSLPTPLQVPLQNLVLCFFTLVVAHQTRRGE